MALPRHTQMVVSELGPIALPYLTPKPPTASASRSVARLTVSAGL